MASRGKRLPQRQRSGGVKSFLVEGEETTAGDVVTVVVAIVDSNPNFVRARVVVVFRLTDRVRKW